MPACRATKDTLMPGCMASSTSRTFSAADHRRRRCTEVMTSNREIGPSEGVVIVVIIGLRLCLISYAECPVEKGGSSFLRFLQDHAARIAIVFTDVMMASETDGLELARIVSRRWPWIGLLVTSSGDVPRQNMPCLRRQSSCQSPWHPDKVDGLYAGRLSAAVTKSPGPLPFNCAVAASAALSVSVAISHALPSRITT